MTECPYCHKEIKSEIFDDWSGDYWTIHDFPCPTCGKLMDIQVESEPVFVAKKKKEATNG